ncbi:hypothetical protein ALP37_200005 [Pseudomonas amygdali pv. sesami]|nr:hypothetical protein ALP37_200005 [Pseudomonas amygdali pv. sesami]
MYFSPTQSSGNVVGTISPAPTALSSRLKEADDPCLSASIRRVLIPKITTCLNCRSTEEKTCREVKWLQSQPQSSSSRT